MMATIRLAVSGLLTSLLALSSEQGFAGSQADNSWKSHPITVTYTGGYSDRRKMKIDKGEILYTTSKTQSGLYLSCIEGQLRVGLSFKPMDIAEAFSNMENGGITYAGNRFPLEKSLGFVNMKLDGGKAISLGKWLNYEDKDIALSRKRKPAAKLYNAVVKNHVIQVRMKRDDWVDLAIPRINAQFADFGAECGIGRKTQPLKKAE